MKNPFKNEDGKFFANGTSKLSFIEDVFAFGLILLLTVFTLVFKLVQEDLHLQIKDSDLVLINLGFMFACVAGIITWREDKHLSLASITDKLPAGVKKVIGCICTAIVPMVLTQLFFVSLCELLNPDNYTGKVWFISERFFFFFMPLCYFAMVAMVISHKENRIAAIVGLVLGVITSFTPITGSMFYVFGTTPESVPFMYKLGDLWNVICDKAIWYFVVLLIILAFAGVPLFVVISAITYVLFSKAGGIVSIIFEQAASQFLKPDIIAIPLFTIAGYVLAQGSAGKRFVNLFNALFGWFRGGTVVATVLVITFFSTFTGVSGVTILALGSLLCLILVGSGYNKDKAESLITSSGALGLLFPPSVAIIMYYTSNVTVIEQFEPGFNVMNLFVAALIPGSIMALAMIVMGIIYDKNKSRPKFSGKAILTGFKDCAFELLLPVLICLTYFTQIFNLFQVAAFAVLYTFILETFVRRDFTLRKAGRVIADSVPVSGGVLFIIAAASAFSYYLMDANVPELVTEFITAHVSSKYVFLILVNLVLLVVGCLMDLYSAILIISPLLLYAGTAFGIPVVQSAVIFLMNLSIGFLTPPVGMDLFISSYAFKKPVSKVIKGVMPFLCVQLVVLMLVTYVPAFTTCLLPEDASGNVEQEADVPGVEDDFDDSFDYESDYSDADSFDAAAVDENPAL
ncbi:MAG: TRAP transporter large permease subunit [Treponema sp.]|nr:TRAP transporter large permease subunit [Treponema sp.]